MSPADRTRPRRAASGGWCAALASALLFGAVMFAAPPRRAAAQAPVLLQGIADLEFWSTNHASTLLTRNDGNPAALAHLDLWGAVEPVSHIVLYATGEFTGGPARNEYETQEAYVDQFGVRYTASRLFVVDAGRLAPIVGTFAARRFATRNPLIGVPDGYPLSYPDGAEMSGETDHFDYRAALVSLPVSHPLYVPVPSSELRPAIGAGFTPVVGMRVGGSFTEGSYLNRSTPAAILFGRSWDDYHQRILAADATFSHGYLETHAEAARGSYDVPGLAGAVVGWTYYGEAKYTLDPRLFVAARVEQNDYPFISPSGGTHWTSGTSNFVDGEVGLGYRVTASLLVKASVRGDRHWEHSPIAAEGRAFAIQVSQAFDAMDLVQRARER